MLLGVLAGVLAGAMWGTVFIVPEILNSYSSMELAVGRYLAYGLISSAILLPNFTSLVARLSLPDYLALFRQALTGSLIYYLLLSLGVKYAGVAPTSIIIGLIPLVVTLLSRKDKASPPVRRMAIPLLLMIASVTALNVDALFRAGADGTTDSLWRGLSCAVGALLCWSWYALDNSHYLKTNPQFTSAEWSGLYGVACGVITIAIWTLATCFSSKTTLALSDNHAWFWACNFMLALVTSVLANQAWNIANRRVPISLSAQLGSSETLFAIVYGAIFSGRGLRIAEVVAIGLLISSLVLSVLAHITSPPGR